jgi:hypothetical protein
MLVEKNNKDVITISIDSSLNPYELQSILDFVKYLEITSKSKARKVEVDAFLSSSSQNWWSKNRKRFVK